MNNYIPIQSADINKLTDNEILFRWRRMPKDYGSIKTMAQLSDRKITDIIKLLNRSGVMVKWRNHDIEAVKVERRGA